MAWHGTLQFAGDLMVLIIRDSLLFTASLWQAAVIVSCASPRTTHEATAGSSKSSLAMTLTGMVTHLVQSPSVNDYNECFVPSHKRTFMEILT